MGSLFAFDSPLWKTMDRVLHFLWLSLLWFLCSLPIVTMGASTTALYVVMFQYAKNKDGYLTASYFKAFKENFKNSTVISFIFGGIGMLLGGGFIVYFQMQTTGLFHLIMMTTFLSICVSFLLANQLVYPLLAAFDNTVSRTLLNTFIMAMTHLPRGILLLSIFIIILMIGTTRFPPLLMIAPALMAYLNARVFETLFASYGFGTSSLEECI